MEELTVAVTVYPRSARRRMCERGITVRVEATVTEGEGGEEAGRQRPESLSRTVCTQKEVQNSLSRST